MGCEANAEKGKRQTFDRRGIIMQLFSWSHYLAAGCWALYRRAAGVERSLENHPQTHTKKVLPATELSLDKFSVSGIPLGLRFPSSYRLWKSGITANLQVKEETPQQRL